MPLHLVVVPHTHWDREWYRTHEAFRYRLVRLLDGLLDALEADPAFRHFTLDGQTIVLDDYLEVRPEARPRIERLVRAGRIQIGPWYVLPDEWLVSGEALVRNLRTGLRSAQAFGGGMPVGYVPDQFGHVGQLPQIFRGFGFDAAVLWRGVGGDIRDSTFLWEAADGTRLLTVYLIHSYGNAARLPTDPEALRRRLAGLVRDGKPHARIETLLLMYGSDHEVPDPALPAALAKATSEAAGPTAEIGTLPGFVARARTELHGDDELTVHRGELRSGLRSPLLVGCASARLPQKQADAASDRLLTRVVEPLAAWLGALGGDPDRGVIDLAWRTALKNHPHDSICGCSIDEVHEEMETRFQRVRDLAGAHREHLATELGTRIHVDEKGFGGVEGPTFAVFQPGASGVTPVEGELEVDVAIGKRGRAAVHHVRTADGRAIPVALEVVDSGVDVSRFEVPAAAAIGMVRGFPADFSGFRLSDVAVRRVEGVLHVEPCLSLGPLLDVDLDAARARAHAALSAEGDALVVFRARRLPRVCVRFVDALPGFGLRVYRLARGRAPAAAGYLRASREDGSAAIANETWRIEFGPDARLHALHIPTGARIPDVLRVVSDGDRGDEYTFDPVPASAPVERPTTARVVALEASDAEARLVIRHRYRVPEALAEDRSRRGARETWLPVTIALRLAAGSDRVDVRVGFTNTARDHRLRAHVRAPFEPERFEVESAFEVAERPIEPEPDAFGSAQPAEQPVGTTPQRGFATLAGGDLALTLANRGNSEVEAVREAGGTGALALTLVRSVGWLSRDDLIMRPRLAGPPFETPGAQCLGDHEAAFSFRLHPDRDPSRCVEAYRFTSPPVLFSAATRRPGPLADGARLLEVDDPEIAVSAVEPRDGGAAVVRLFSTAREARTVRVAWNGPGARSLAPVDLLERPAAVDARPAPGRPAALNVTFRPGQIVTLLVDTAPRT